MCGSRGAEYQLTHAMGSGAPIPPPKKQGSLSSCSKALQLMSPTESACGALVEIANTKRMMCAQPGCSSLLDTNRASMVKIGSRCALPSSGLES